MNTMPTVKDFALSPFSCTINHIFSSSMSIFASLASIFWIGGYYFGPSGSNLLIAMSNSLPPDC